jgi:hypothetical protein
MVKFFLCLTNYTLRVCHEDIWGNGGIAPPFFTSSLGVGKWSASHAGCFTHLERSPGNHITGGRLGPELV